MRSAKLDASTSRLQTLLLAASRTGVSASASAALLKLDDEEKETRSANVAPCAVNVDVDVRRRLEIRADLAVQATFGNLNGNTVAPRGGSLYKFATASKRRRTSTFTFIAPVACGTLKAKEDLGEAKPKLKAVRRNLGASAGADPNPRGAGRSPSARFAHPGALLIRDHPGGVGS